MSENDDNTSLIVDDGSVNDDDFQWQPRILEANRDVDEVSVDSTERGDPQESIRDDGTGQQSIPEVLPLPPPILEDDRAEWVVRIEVSASDFKKGNRRYFAKERPKWKGLEWFTLMQFQHEKSHLGIPDIYVGYDEVPAEEICSLHLVLQFQFTLLDNNFKEIAVSRAASHAFGYTQSEDRGFQSAFEKDDDDFGRASKPNRFNGKDTSFIIKIVLLEQFQTETIGLDYNSKLSTGMVGLENLGATCYLNSLLQMLFHINRFRKAVYMLPHGDEVYGSSTTLALQNVFIQLQTSTKEVNTQDLLTAFGWTSQDAFAQQDVQEMMRILLDKLEEKMKGTVVDGAIKSLFSGSVRSFIRCVNVDYSSNRDEEFYDIQLDVKGCKDIYESFNKYVAKEMLEGDNQYDAGELGKQNAEKGMIFTKFPPVLTLLLKRFDFDLQRMRFIKIHDSYQFQTRINLDPYLAEDAPPESRKNPNMYVLHSVLVHTGDVGGGHYYCFIRPSSGYSYEPVSMRDVLQQWPKEEATNHVKEILSYHRKTETDGKWYKFNDETVYEVREYEAVNVSYGRSSSIQRPSSQLVGSICSAYMLIYIREAEAKDIMRSVEIPVDLIKRLDYERERLNVEQRIMQRRKIYKSVAYATEREISYFREYSKYQDFVNESTLPRLRFINGSSIFSMILRVAEQLACSPTVLKLFTMDRLAKKFSSIRPIEEIDANNYLDMSVCSDDTYYVHVRDSPLDERIITLFDEHYHIAKANESRWLNKLRSHLLTLPEFSKSTHLDTTFIDGEDYDNLTEGCGLFCNNELLINFIPDPSVRHELKSSINNIEESLRRLMREYISVINKDFQNPYYAFIKIFDPFDLIPTDVDMLGYKLRSHANHFSNRYPEPLTVNQSIQLLPAIPLKYIGCLALDDDIIFEDVVRLIQNLLNFLYINYLDLASNSNQIDDEFNFYRIDGEAMMSLIINPNGLGHESQIFNMRSDLLQQKFFQMFPSCKDISDYTSGMFTFEYIGDATDNAYNRKSLLPFDTISNAKQWLHYMATKKSFLVEPLSSFDMEMMLKAIQKRNQYKLDRISRLSALQHHEYHTTIGKRKHTDESRNDSQGKVSDGSLQDTQSLDNDDNDDATSIHSAESTLSSIVSIDGTNMTMRAHVNAPVTRVGQVFVEIPVNMALRLVVSHVHRQLKCGPEIGRGNLALYAITDKEWQNEVSYVRPMIAMENKTLDAYLQDRKTNVMMIRQSHQQTSTYSLFYQILPFCLMNGDQDLRIRIRFFEIIIIDNRIRLWRRKFLKYKEYVANKSNKRRRGENTSNYDDENGHIEWPEDMNQIAINSEFLVDYRVFARARIDDEVHVLMNYLRGVIGIPTNIASNGEIHIPSKSVIEEITIDTHTSENCSDESDEDISNMLQPIPLTIDNDAGDDNTVAIKEIDKNIASEDRDSVNTGNHNLQYSSHQIHPLSIDSANNHMRKFDSISDLIDDSESIQYPFVLTLIVDSIIEDIYSPHLSVRMLPISWVEAVEDLATSSKHRLAVQHIPLTDLPFMRGESLQAKSMIVSVFSFTLLGSGCIPWPFYGPEPTMYPGPIITYVREDDDIETLCRRIANITGENEEEASKYRIAVVHKKTPTFLSRQGNNSNDPKRSPSPLSHGAAFFRSDGIESENNNTSNHIVSSNATGTVTQYVGNVWSLLCEKYPHYATGTLEMARSVRPNGPLLRGQNEKLGFPQIGIQRSAVKTTNQRLSRPSSGIRISG